MPITATTPVTAPAAPSMVFDQWYVTQIIGKFDGKTGPTIITLQRANITDGVVTLMPNTTPDAQVTFNVDILKEIAGGNTTLATAFSSIVTAIDAYATAKKLL